MNKWHILAEDTGDLFPIGLALKIFTQDVPKILDVPSDSWFFKGENHEWVCGMDPVFWRGLCDAAFNKVNDDKLFVSKVKKKVLFYLKPYEEVSLKIFNSDLSNFSNEELWFLFDSWHKAQIPFYAWGVIPVFVDFDPPKLSKCVQEVVKKKLKAEFKDNFFPEYFSVLTTPSQESNLRKQEVSFLRLAVEVQKNLLDLFSRDIGYIKGHLPVDFDNKLTNHVDNFGWLGYGFLGPGWSKDYFLNLLKHFSDDAEEQLNNLIQRHQTLVRQKKEIFDELNFSDGDLHLINSLTELGYIKLFRKDALFKSYFLFHPWLVEIAKRFDLSVSQVRHMTDGEFKDLLVNNKPVPRDVLNERIKYYFYVLKDGVESIHHGSDAKNLFDDLAEKKQEVVADKLKGDCACQGSARGRVKLIKSVEDLKKMNKGDILISPATSPQLVPAMKKAAAIVTDEGGITCHAAIVSRELGIPCVTGTKFVTRAFKDGDFVEVDASNGFIRRIKK